MAPAARNGSRSSVRPTMSRPTVQEPSTHISVRFGPIRSARMPQPKEATTAATVRPINTKRDSVLLKPMALMAKRLITAIAVLIGSV
jgi:hypothetical protein